MPEVKECEARQYSDQMYCKRCHLTWDMNDPEPPECEPQANFSHAQQILKELER